MEASAYRIRDIKGEFLCGAPYYLVFKSISEDYYFFKKSLSKHKFNQLIQPSTFDLDLDIIFQGEPSELYSNVNNGFGIVAGFQEVIIPFEEL